MNTSNFPVGNGKTVLSRIGADGSRFLFIFFIDTIPIVSYTSKKEIAMDLAKIDYLDIILVCGLYGSGKTEFAVKYFKGKDRSRVSRSDIRKYMYEMTHFGERWKADLFTEDEDALVKHIERKTVEQLLHSKKKVLIINTFATKKSRQAFIDIARQTKKTIGAVFLNRPLEECLERNAKNELPAPQEVIYKLHHRIELPEKSEGFEEVITVTYKQ
jgi:predicted kinase